MEQDKKIGIAGAQTASTGTAQQPYAAQQANTAQQSDATQQANAAQQSDATQRTSAAQKKAIAVIDGNSLMHRAYHAIPPVMTSPSGLHTNAVYGFLSMFIRMLSDFHPWGVIVCFDKGKPAVRLKMYPEYKAQRPLQDPELHEQFPLAKELLSALAVPVVELEGWEGDDLLGTLAKEGAEAGYRMLLVTGDKDMYQLSSDDVAIVSTKKGMSEVSIMTPAAVKDLYGGITPDLVPDFYGLKGDVSDNIPGVPGIGPKKAQALIEEFGSLEGVLANADKIPGKMGQNIRDHAADARLSKKVATIRTDAPVELDFEAAEFPSFDEAAAQVAFGRLGFTTIAARLMRALHAENQEKMVTSISADGLRSGEIEGGFKWRELETSKDAKAGKPRAGADVVPGTNLQDAVQFSLPPVLKGDAARAALNDATEKAQWLGVSLATSADAGTLFDTGSTLWVSTEKGLISFSGAEAQEVLLRLFKENRVASIDIKELIHEIYPTNLDARALLDISEIAPDRIMDVSVASYLLKSQERTYTAQDIALEYLNASVDAALLEDSQTKAQVAASVASKVCALMQELLKQTGASTCFEQIEMPLIPVLCQMEREGMQADALIFREQARELSSSIDKLAVSIFEQAGEEFNIDSPAQLSHVLFDVIKLPTTGLKKTKRGYYSTNAAVLDELAKEYDFVRNIMRYREENKILKTYLLALPAVIKSDGRIHTTFNQTVAATGRLSSSNPNLQNIPVRSELGHRVRKAFIVPEGSVFLACDYSQIELRLLAHFAGDEHLIRAFKEGEDFHAQTAARVFGVPLKEVTADLRSRAKAVNFGIVYGQQAFGLAQTLGISRHEAQLMIDSYFEAYPGVRAFLDKTVASAAEDGFVTTLYNRRRLVPDILSSNRALKQAAERIAMNHPMQGSAADIIKLAMIEVSKALARKGFGARMILQIHDELDLQVPETELDEVSELVTDIMEHVVELSVPLVVDASYGKNWASAK